MIGIATVVARKTVTDQPKDQTCRGDPLCPGALGGLCLFLDDGRIEIDNNIVERAIRPLALNRKNALFAGSDGGAQHWAVVASLIETCKLLGVDPLGYLTDVITRIVNGHPQSRLDDLCPGPIPLHHSSRPWPENDAYHAARRSVDTTLCAAAAGPRSPSLHRRTA